MNTKKMTKEFREKLNSKTMWTETIEPWITDHFIFLGFNKPKDFMKVRLFDLFNLDCVDNNRAEEIILGLSHLLYPEREKRGEPTPKRYAYYRILSSLMPDPTLMTIEDLISEPFFAENEMLAIFDCVTQYFYKSDEYDSRHYKYGSLTEIKNKNKKCK